MYQAICQQNGPTIWASVRTFTRGGERPKTIIPNCIWVRAKNGRWIRRAVVEQINATFEGADVTIIDDAILITSDRFAYRFKTWKLERLTPTKRKGRGNEPE